MQVFLIRHPQPVIAPGICYGQLDVDCVDPETLASQLLPRLPAAAPLISSPLRRCRRLAACLHPAPAYDARLMELDFGRWEGQAWHDVPRALLDLWAADVLHAAPHGGESAHSLQCRALAVIAQLQQAGHPAAILVTHAGVMRALSGAALNLAASEWTQLRFAYGELVKIEFACRATPP